MQYVGPASAQRVVVHLLDWHYVPRDLCQADGIDFDANLAEVEKVQADQLEIMRWLIREHGVKEIYSEGLTEKKMPDVRVRVDVLNDLNRIEDLGGMDAETARRQRELILEIGTPGRLLLTKEIDVLPLEEDDAHGGARPIAEADGVRYSPVRLDARRRAMVRRLAATGLAVLVLGGSHDLGPHFDTGVLYLRVTPQSYPAN